MHNEIFGPTEDRLLGSCNDLSNVVRCRDIRDKDGVSAKMSVKKLYLKDWTEENENIKVISGAWIDYGVKKIILEYCPGQCFGNSGFEHSWSGSMELVTFSQEKKWSIRWKYNENRK